MGDLKVNLLLSDGEFRNKLLADAKQIQDLGDKASPAARSLAYMTGLMVKLVQASSNYAGLAKKLTKQLTDLKVNFEQLSDAEKNSDFGRGLIRAMEEIEQKAAMFQDIAADTREAVKNMASDTANWDATKEGIQLASNAMQAYCAITALTGQENQKLEKIIAKLAAVQGIANTAIAIGNALQKQSAFMQGFQKLVNYIGKIGQETNAKKALNNETKKEIQLDQEAGQKKGMLSKALDHLNSKYTKTGIVMGGLSMAMMLLLNSFDRAAESEEKAKQELERYNAAQEKVAQEAKQLGSAVGGSVSKVQLTYKELKKSFIEAKKAGKDLNEWAKDHKTALNDIYLGQADIIGLEQAFVSNTEDYVKAMSARARAAGLMQVAAQKYAEAIAAMEHKDFKPANMNIFGKNQKEAYKKQYGLSDADFESKGKSYRGTYDRTGWWSLTLKGIDKINAQINKTVSDNLKKQSRTLEAEVLKIEKDVAKTFNNSHINSKNPAGSTTNTKTKTTTTQANKNLTAEESLRKAYEDYTKEVLYAKDQKERGNITEKNYLETLKKAGTTLLDNLHELNRESTINGKTNKLKGTLNEEIKTNTEALAGVTTLLENQAEQLKLSEKVRKDADAAEKKFADIKKRQAAREAAKNNLAPEKYQGAGDTFISTQKKSDQFDIAQKNYETNKETYDDAKADIEDIDGVINTIKDTLKESGMSDTDIEKYLKTLGLTDEEKKAAKEKRDREIAAEQKKTEVISDVKSAVLEVANKLTDWSQKSKQLDESYFKGGVTVLTTDKEAKQDEINRQNKLWKLNTRADKRDLDQEKDLSGTIDQIDTEATNKLEQSINDLGKQIASSIKDLPQLEEKLKEVGLTFLDLGIDVKQLTFSTPLEELTNIQLKIEAIPEKKEIQVVEDEPNIKDLTPDQQRLIKTLHEGTEAKKEATKASDASKKAMDAERTSMSNLNTELKKADSFNKVGAKIQSANNSLSQMNGAVSGMYSTWKNLNDQLDDMDGFETVLTYIDAITSSISGIFSFIDGINGIIEVFNKLAVSNQANAKANAAAAQEETGAALGATAAKSGEAMAGAAASGASLPFPANIAAIAAGVAAVVSVIAMIASISGAFANGGIVKGPTTLGDYNLARVNSGEMILNQGLQGKLFRLLNSGTAAGNTISGGPVEFRIKGSELVGVQKNYYKKQNRL